MSARAAITTIVSLTAVVAIAMVLTDMAPNIPLVAAVCVLGGASWWLLSELNASVGHPTPPSAISGFTTLKSADRRVWVLRDTLMAGRHGDQSSARLYQTLVDLIDDQLVAGHNVDRHDDPAAAEAILGPELSEFVSSSSSADGLTRPRYIDHIVTLIEEI